MVQTSLLVNENDRPVNVASVPHRSLFRYPGGKTWLIPRIREWLYGMPSKPACFVEPFLGGGIVSLSVAFEDLADSVVAVELDDEVAAVWRVLMGDRARWLRKRIGDFEVTGESVNEILAARPDSLHEKAFRTIVKNRVNRGGILAPGAGLQKFGENGKGLRSRWYPDTLQKRIDGIERIRHKITFMEDDGVGVLRS